MKKKAKKLGITLINFSDDEVRDLVDELYKKHGDKIYQAHWTKCEVMQ